MDNDFLKNAYKGMKVKLLFNKSNNDFTVLSIHDVADDRVSVVTNCGFKRWFYKNNGVCVKSEIYRLQPVGRK